MRIFLAISLLLIALLASLSGCASPLGLIFPTLYASLGIKAKIVDATTGQPLSGVMVMATWGNITPDYSIVYAETAQYSCDQLVNVVTATSGEDGQFEIPAWSGKWGHCQFMLIYDPQLLLYKPGYEVVDMQNAGTYRDDYTPATIPTVPRWNGQTIRMRPLGPHTSNQYSDNYVDNLTAYSRDLGVLMRKRPKECFWNEARPALLMLLQEERRLRPYIRAGLDMYGLDLARPDDPAGVGDFVCGAPKGYYSSLIAEAAKTPPDMPLSGPQTSDDTRAIDFDIVNQVRASVEHAPDEATDQDAGLVYHVNLNLQNPGESIVTAVFPLNVKPEAAAGLYEDYPSSNPWKVDRGFNCYNFTEVSAAEAASTGANRIECSWFEKVQTSMSGCNRDCSPDYYFPETHSWALTTATFLRPTSATLPEYVQLDHVDDLVVSTRLQPAGPSLWRLPPASQTAYLVVHPPGKRPRSNDLCEKMLPDSLRDYLAINEPLWRVVRMSDQHSNDAKHGMPAGRCPTVLRGHFTGGGDIDYMIGLMMNFTAAEIRSVKAVSISWFLAQPHGDDWAITQSVSGCFTPVCHISLAKPGVYHFQGRRRVLTRRMLRPTLGFPRPTYRDFQYDLLMKHDGYALTYEFSGKQDHIDYGYYDNGSWKTGRTPISH